MGIVILASCQHYFIRVHSNLAQHPINNISIFIVYNDGDDSKEFHWRNLPGPAEFLFPLRTHCSPLFQQEGRGGDRCRVSLFQPAVSITLSEYVKIQFNIQVMMYPFQLLMMVMTLKEVHWRNLPDPAGIHLPSRNHCSARIWTLQRKNKASLK